MSTQGPPEAPILFKQTSPDTLVCLFAVTDMTRSTAVGGDRVPDAMISLEPTTTIERLPVSTNNGNAYETSSF